MSKASVKAVLDTNVFINAWFFNDSNCQYILDLVKQREMYLAFSQDTIGELLLLTKNFARKEIDDPQKRLLLIESVGKLFYYGSSVNTVGMPDIHEVQDKTDLMFVHTAIGYNADYLITNDTNSGMFDLNDDEYTFKVINPDDFLKLYIS